MNTKQLPHQEKLEAFMKLYKTSLNDDEVAYARVLYKTDPVKKNLIWFDHLVDAFLQEMKLKYELKRAA